MKKAQLFLLLLLSTLVYISNSSCNRSDFSKEIAQVDSLSIKVDSALLKISAIDTSQIMSYVPLMKKDMIWINDSISKETITDAKMFIFKVKTANKLTLTFSYDYAKAIKELEFSKTQLSDLRNDLQNASIEKTDASQYIEDEKKALSIILKHTDKMMEKIELLKDYPEVRKEFYLKVRN